ncbi:MAG: hypothetical protein DME30_11280 [Verrucomicrobia bacterium]|nr:MAG: hypothetical protein DME30_11280 [Verrucomicrobiota bacterium]
MGRWIGRSGDDVKQMRLRRLIIIGPSRTTLRRARSTAEYLIVDLLLANQYWGRDSLKRYIVTKGN